MTTPPEPSPDEYAVSPAIGPVPGIYVHGQGWLFEVQTDPATLDQQLAAMMDPGAYRDLAGA